MAKGIEETPLNMASANIGIGISEGWFSLFSRPSLVSVHGRYFTLAQFIYLIRSDSRGSFPPCTIAATSLTCHHTGDSGNLPMDQDEGYIIPLTDQRVFGAGIKKNRVKFVPPEPAGSKTKADTSNGAAAADLYRSIVLQEGWSTDKFREANEPQIPNTVSESAAPNAELEGASCEICNLSLKSPNSTVPTPSNPHEASLVHQVCLSHSHPPSHLDRTRKGLKYLSFYGWDPDSRLGLGAAGDGRLAPIRGKLKNDTLGVGFEEKLKKNKGGVVGAEKQMEKLDAKKVRKLEAEGRRKRARLQEMFYGKD